MQKLSTALEKPVADVDTLHYPVALNSSFHVAQQSLSVGSLLPTAEPLLTQQKQEPRPHWHSLVSAYPHFVTLILSNRNTVCLMLAPLHISATSHLQYAGGRNVPDSDCSIHGG